MTSEKAGGQIDPSHQSINPRSQTLIISIQLLLCDSKGGVMDIIQHACIHVCKHEIIQNMEQLLV